MTSTETAPLLKNKNQEQHRDGGGEEKQERGSSSWRSWNLWCRELRLVWYIAGPAVATSVLQYSLGSITQTLVGHIGTLELAAVGLQNLVVSGIGFGFMLGMGSALETLCGQAYGAGKLNMLGIYLQRSWLILLCTAVIMSPIYIFATPLLKLMGQSNEIAELAGKFCIWMLPELFAFALNFPIQRFLQAQSKVLAMTWISAVAVVLHVILSWLFIIKLEMGLVGAAITLNFAWFVLVAGQLGYVIIGCREDTWTGFSWLVFSDLCSFLGLSLASAVMLCLEYWVLMFVILLAGLLPNPDIAVDAASICMNVEGWVFMIPLGLLAAVSVRVSNELGAGRPQAAKFSVLVVVTVSVIIQTILALAVLYTRKEFPVIFTENQQVRDKVSTMAYFLCASIIFASIQSILSGMAVGAGWQTTVAYVNLGSYYIVGLGTSALLALKFKLGLEGIWSGLLFGILVQTIILVVITLRTDWENEAALASDRVSAHS